MSMCSKAFYGKQKLRNCCGPSASCYHLSCQHISKIEYAYYMDPGVSIFMQPALEVCAHRDVMIHQSICIHLLFLTSLQENGFSRKVTCIASFTKSDEYVALCMQLKPIHLLSGVCTLDFIKSDQHCTQTECGCHSVKN
jgi:hypothetical protein